MSIIANSPQEITPLKSGDKTPAIFLKDENGRMVNVNKSLSEQPAVLIIYRGGWCPYCNMQMSALKDIEDEFYKLGYNIFGISPDKPEKLAESRGKHNFKYKLLSDSKMFVSRAFGLAYRVPENEVKMMKEKFNMDIEGDSGENHHLLPVPAVYLIDSNGIFGFQYVNPDHTVRMNTKDLLKIAKERKK